MPRAPFSGFSLVEALVALAVLGLVVLVGTPALLAAAGDARLDLAAGKIAGTMRRTRSLAIARQTYTGVRFEISDGVLWAGIYRDGDGDGIRTRDVERGIDPPVVTPGPIARLHGSVRLGFPDGGPPPRKPSGRGRMRRLEDPIRFGRSDIASFGPLGTSSPGSIYLTDGRRLAVVRLHSTKGRVRVMRYDPREEVWR